MVNDGLTVCAHQGASAFASRGVAQGEEEDSEAASSRGPPFARALQGKEAENLEGPPSVFAWAAQGEEVAKAGRGHLAQDAAMERPSLWHPAWLFSQHATTSKNCTPNGWRCGGPDGLAEVPSRKRARRRLTAFHASIAMEHKLKAGRSGLGHEGWSA